MHATKAAAMAVFTAVLIALCTALPVLAGTSSGGTSAPTSVTSFQTTCTPTGPICFSVQMTATGPKTVMTTSGLQTMPYILCGGGPVPYAYPTLSGTGQPGNTLTSTSGGWQDCSGVVISISYSWNGPNGHGNTYSVTSSDVGSSIYSTVTATDVYGSNNASSNSIYISAPSGGGGGGGGGDSQSPTVPTSLRVGTVTASSIALTWTASYDNVGVAGYGLYTNGSGAGSTTATSATFSNLSCATSYTLSVDAYDAAGNRSAKASITANTSACSGGGGGGGGSGSLSCPSQYVTGRDSDHDGIDDGCDSSPFPYNYPVAGPTSLVYSSDVAGPTRVLYSGTTYTCPTGARLKTRIFRAQWREPVISTTFLAYNVKYQACYVPGVKIVWGLAFNPADGYALIPWNWRTYNDSGYPFMANYGSKVVFQWQGSAAICVFNLSFACGPTKHPGEQIVFYPNGSEGRSSWVN